MHESCVVHPEYANVFDLLIYAYKSTPKRGKYLKFVRNIIADKKFNQVLRERKDQKIQNLQISNKKS